MRFEQKKISWEEMYEYVKKYYEHYKNLEVPTKFKTNDGFTPDDNGKVKLGAWLKNQKYIVSPESERGKLLMQVGMNFEKRNISWEEMYEYATKYYEHYGNLYVPARFKTNDGFTPDENGKINLGNWIICQRHNLSLESEKGKLLSQIGMRFENKQSTLSWEELYDYAKKYYEHYGNLEVPVRFKTNDGYTYDEKGNINLGVWITYQRKSVVPESTKGKLLTQIGMNFEKRIISWEEMYEQAKKYQKYYGNLEVPKKFRTDDIYTYNKDGKIKLGEWIDRMRKTIDPESEKGKLLSQIGMRFNEEVPDNVWLNMYSYAKRYYDIWLYLANMPREFKTNDGVTYDKYGKINLGLWVDEQKNLVAPESKRGRMLAQLGMDFPKSKLTWYTMYELAKKYYEYYDNLRIPITFKTNDGITYDKNGKFELGLWLFRQFENNDPTTEQGVLLSNIGMIWDVDIRLLQLHIACDAHKIDFEKYKDELFQIPISLLCAKMDFLDFNSIPIIDSDGNLNEIFYMNESQLIEKYNISKKGLLSKYKSTLNFCSYILKKRLSEIEKNNKVL